jgi:hypothetical protein
MFTPMRLVLLRTIDPSLSANVCAGAEGQEEALQARTARANAFFIWNLLFLY